MDRPAILGGESLFPDGPPDWPTHDEAVAAALERAIRDGTWGKYDGGHVEHLHGRLRDWSGHSFALTCASGTLAVEVALRALRVEGGEVVLAAYDYPGNFLSAHAAGAQPVLADVNPRDWNLSPASLEAALGPRTRAVVASHLHGGVVAMRELMAVCSARGVPVVEDAAQAPGATVQGRPAGAWGDVGVFSFGGSKLLTAGRGGALVTSRPEAYQRARLALGRGNNLVAPLSELQAAALLPQFDALAARHERRATNVELLTRLLQGVPGITPFASGVEGSPAYYKLGLRYDESAFGLPRDRLVRAMRAEGVALDEGFRALHVGRAPSRWRANGPLAEAEHAHRGCVVLHHPVLLGGEEEMRRIARALGRLREFADRVPAGPG
ncbi:MAG: aminotransferase class V-fold PLP-dependent enzyme [Gemmataceae bacterium]